MTQSKNFEIEQIHNVYKNIRLGVSELANSDRLFLAFADVINNLTEDVRSYAIYLFKKDPVGMMIKLYLLSKASGDTNEFLEWLMVQWGVSSEIFQKYTQELRSDGLYLREINSLKPTESLFAKLISFVYF